MQAILYYRFISWTKARVRGGETPILALIRRLSENCLLRQTAGGSALSRRGVTSRLPAPLG